MEQNEKIIVYERTPFYYETDRMGIIHHSNYVRWFEEARIHMVEKMGYSFAKMEMLGIMSPVLDVKVEYKQPARFGETVRIETRQTFFNGVRVSFAYKVMEKETGELKAVGSSSHCFVNEKFQPVSLKRSFPEMYEIYAPYTVVES